MSHRSTYVARIHRVLDHIDRHLAEPLDLPTLAGVAHFSPWHFHRLFQAFTGETLADCVRRRRLERAATRLLMEPPDTALAIALDMGFGSAEVFTRAFKTHFGVTPGAWRRGAYRDWWAHRRDELSKIHQGHRKPDQALQGAFREDEIARQSRPAIELEGTEMNVELKTLPTVRVAYMRFIGPYGDPRIGQLWQRFMAWCAQHRQQLREGTYGLSHDSPDITAPDKCRYDACVAVADDFRPEGEVNVQTVPGGLYACTSFRGTPDDIHAAWQQLFAQWLPDSGYQGDDRPAIEAYGPQVEGDEASGCFSCELCLPVRAM
jgi:AraC family transcriptional regulator